MSYHYHAPLDPECPEVADFYESLYGDPMTEAMDAPIADILEGFERRHRAKCERCRNHGCENIEVRD